MAAALVRQATGDAVEVHSAETNPAALTALSVQTLEEVGGVNGRGALQADQPDVLARIVVVALAPQPPPAETHSYH
jgi:hypothetical protein